MNRLLTVALLALTLALTGAGALVALGSSAAAATWSPSTSSSTWYKLTPRTNTGLRVDVRNARLGNGTAVQQYSSNGTVSQQFGFRSAGNGYYRIVTKLSDSASTQYLNVWQAGKSNGTKVETLVKATGYQQQWKIYNLGNGYMKLVPRHATKKCLDVPGASRKSAVQLQIYTCNGIASQQFKVARTSSRMWYSTATCPNLVVIGVRGSNEGQRSGVISGFGDNVSLASRDAVRRIGRTGSYRYKAITYPAYLSSDVGKYLDSVDAGAADLKKQVHHLTSKCGTGTRYAIIGYSQGSHVIREGVASLNSASRARVAAVGLIADPTRRGSNLSKREVGRVERFGTTLSKSGALLEFMRAYNSCSRDCEDLAPSYDKFLKAASSKVATICQSSDGVCNAGAASAWSTAWGSKAQHVQYYRDRPGKSGWVIHEALAANGYK
ncbi:cutinase family protein [Nocardioides marmoriginsengisoli]|uniref:Cutinase family protein n=1 Tax=Nocardioides marmoriginsengisoli TaxID=661483 RepID=A0A3N0CNQ8_9ACTN|nr:RICIN domain-containing protein [Nocardioides marmoriginsengisoli]RNL65114.1 cutinase family protein [Nocardioides marmoriginsengisoli]